MSLLTQLLHVFLGAPLSTTPITFILVHFFTQLFSSFRSTCPNHLNLPRSNKFNKPCLTNVHVEPWQEILPRMIPNCLFIALPWTYKYETNIIMKFFPTQTPTEWYVPHRRTHRRKAYHERSSSVGGYSDIFQEVRVVYISCYNPQIPALLHLFELLYLTTIR